MKTFYSLEDIENLVAQGVRELIVDADSVLTDVAQDAAARMGLKLVASRGPVAPAASLAPVAPVPEVGARPRGCQHGPLGEFGQAKAAPAQARTPAESAGRSRQAGPSGGLVDDLVDAVRKMASQGSSG